MEYRILGRTGFSISDIGFGAMTIGGEVFGSTDDKESLRALNRAVDLGMNFIDTADAYGRGHSEELVGSMLKTRRDEVVIATKGGNRFDVRQGYRDFDPDYISSALERSLIRLGIETIDLYQLHNPPQEILRSGEIFERLDRHKREGKIRFYGVSVQSHADGVTAIQTGKPDTIQVVYNMLHQEPEFELFPLAQRDNIGVIARVPFERGLLAGRLRAGADFAQNDGRAGLFRGDSLESLAAVVEKLSFVVGEDVPSIGNAALRFSISHPAVATVIPGIRTVQQLEENIEASGNELRQEHIARLRRLWREELTEFKHH